MPWVFAYYTRRKTWKTFPGDELVKWNDDLAKGHQVTEFAWVRYWLTHRGLWKSNQYTVDLVTMMQKNHDTGVMSKVSGWWHADGAEFRVGIAKEMLDDEIQREGGVGNDNHNDSDITQDGCLPGEDGALPVEDGSLPSAANSPMPAATGDLPDPGRLPYAGLFQGLNVEAATPEPPAPVGPPQAHARGRLDDMPSEQGLPPYGAKPDPMTDAAPREAWRPANTWSEGGAASWQDERCQARDSPFPGDTRRMHALPSTPLPFPGMGPRLGAQKSNSQSSHRRLGKPLSPHAINGAKEQEGREWEALHTICSKGAT